MALHLEMLGYILGLLKGFKCLLKTGDLIDDLIGDLIGDLTYISTYQKDRILINFACYYGASLKQNVKFDMK